MSDAQKENQDHVRLFATLKDFASFCTGSFHMFGDGADRDFLILIDPFSKDGRNSIAIMQGHPKLTEAVGEYGSGEDFDNFRAFRSKYKDEEGRTYNYLVTTNATWYDRMVNATLLAKTADLRTKERRVKFFHAYVDGFLEAASASHKVGIVDPKGIAQVIVSNTLIGPYSQ